MSNGDGKMNSMGLNNMVEELRELVRREAEALAEENAKEMEKESMSHSEVARYGPQLQRLLDQHEQRDREEGQSGERKAESGNELFGRDMMRRNESDVPKNNPENGAWRDLPGREPGDVAGRNPDFETCEDMQRQTPKNVSEKHLKNGASRDMERRDTSAEAIEQFAQETLPEPVEATDPTTKIHRRQLLAICGLLCGSTITNTANQVGVNRRTVHRWMHDPKFQAAYRYCEAELRMAAQAQVAGLTEKAVQCVSDSLDRGNARVGLELLKQLRVFSTRATPDRIAKAQERKALVEMEEEE